ncbi:MAG: hypothetical protein JXR88_11500 [Clostridia bacterium]|nr:hypothetical protein [Clostridia bacterium]
MRRKSTEETMLFEFSQLNMMHFEPCSEEEVRLCKQCIENEQTLPSGYFQDFDGKVITFFKIDSTEKEHETIRTIIETRKLRYLRTIRNCFVFLTIIITLRELFEFLSSLG